MRPANFVPGCDASTLNPLEDEHGNQLDYKEWKRRQKSEERRRNDRKALIKKLTSGMGPQNSKIVQLNEYICKMRQKKEQQRKAVPHEAAVYLKNLAEERSKLAELRKEGRLYLESPLTGSLFKSRTQAQLLPKQAHSMYRIRV